MYTRAGFGAGLGNLSAPEKAENIKAASVKIPNTAMSSMDTDYMDLILAAKKADQDDKMPVGEKIVVWEKVADYQKSVYAKEQAEARIKAWQDYQKKQRARGRELKIIYPQYVKDKEKLVKLLSYPDDFISREQKAAYQAEFDRVYSGVSMEMEKVISGEHKLSGMIKHNDASDGRFIKYRNGLVEDTVTDLIWQGNYETGKTWKEAVEYCKGLSLGGRRDWRLPDKKEVEDLIDNSKGKAAYQDFPDMPSRWFWTSTSDSGDLSCAWTVGFLFGGVKSSVSKIEFNNVRCVRTGP
ncbi:MAG: DUF1566 domain-containing protein [Candidatus Omnitrophota bacterium]